MNYQGVVWQEIFLERHYTNAAPQRPLLSIRGSNCSRGWRTTSSTARACTDSKHAGRSQPIEAVEDFVLGPVLEIAISDLKAATGSGSGALKDAIR